MGHGPDEGKRGPIGLLVLWTLVVVVPLTIWFAPLGIDPKIQKALAITAFMIGSWITHWQDVAISGLMGLYLFWATGVVGFGEAFHGFATTTPWFLFGAILFGLMATKSGLARRLAFIIMRGIGHTYSRLLLGIVVADFLLTFIVPSGIARVVIMSAVAHGPRRVLRLWPGQPDREGHVHPPRVHGDHLRQDDHRRRGVDNCPRPDRTRRRSPRAVEPVVPGLSAVRHPDDLHRLAAGAVDVSPGARGAARRRGVPAR